MSKKRKRLKCMLVTTIVFVGLPLSSCNGVTLSMNRCAANLQKTVDNVRIGEIMKTDIDDIKITIKESESAVLS